VTPTAARVRQTLVAAVPAALLVAFLLWFGLAQGEDRYWIDLGVKATSVAAAVVGLNLLLGYTGQLSLGHFAFFLYGGFVGAIWAVEDWGLHPWLGFPAAFLAGAVLGALLALTCCHLRGFYLTVVTLAFGLLVASAALVLDSLFSGLSGRPVNEPLNTEFWFIPEDNPNRYLVGLYWIGAGVLLVSLYLTANLVHSRWGRAFKAIREAEVAAGASGVPTYWYKVSSFALSAGLVSLAGVVAAQTTLSVTMRDGTAVVAESFRLVIDAVIGGLGTLAGPVVGAFVFTLGLGINVGDESLESRLGAWVPAVLAGAVLLMTVVAPDGLVGRFKRLAGGLVAQFAPPPPCSTVPATPAPNRAADPGAPVLSVYGVRRTFGGLSALSGVDLTVTAGEVHALIGPNGSGKSTLVNVVTGIYRPDSGHVALAGVDITGARPHAVTRAGIARTFQNGQVWRRMTVVDNVMVGGHTRTSGSLALSLLLPAWLRPWEASARSHAEGLLAFVGLSERGNDLAGTLPFADLRRLEIARALAAKPDLLILDEPAAGMHPGEVRQLIDLVRAVRDSGITVLLIEHHMEVVTELADRVSVLNFGRVIAEGTPGEIATNPLVVDAYLGEAREATDEAGRPARVPVSAAVPAMLTVRDLHVQYGAAPAVLGIDLDVHQGEVVALIGANGAGKTTTLKTSSGVPELLKSVRGQITFLGERIEHRPAHEIARMGMAHVPEGRRLFPESTVEENLLLGAYRRRDHEIMRDVEAVYDRFPILGERRRQPAGLLSGGEQQMLAIGRALTSRPRFLLLDEPSLGLAPIIVDEVFAVIEMLAGEGVTILLVEQLAARALEIADRAYVIETGRIVKHGAASDLLRDPEVQAAYLGG
jgi:ABC-type branched-subunit amino acid transport system ATPase component/ABC-type branched-subunit amino acid transport system permease subunit